MQFNSSTILLRDTKNGYNKVKIKERRVGI